MRWSIVVVLQCLCLMSCREAQFESKVILNLNGPYQPTESQVNDILQQPSFASEIALREGYQNPEDWKELQEALSRSSVERKPDPDTSDSILIVSVQATGKEKTAQLANSIGNQLNETLEKNQIEQAENQLKALDEEIRQQEEIVAAKRAKLVQLMDLQKNREAETEEAIPKSSLRQE